MSARGSSRRYWLELGLEELHCARVGIGAEEFALLGGSFRVVCAQLVSCNCTDN